VTNKCDYGCGNDAIIQFKNGKFCCNKSKNRCQALRKKNSLGQENNGGVWNKGLTSKTDSRVKLGCDKGNKERNALLKSGKIKVWNKGLTKYTHETLKKSSELMKLRKGYYHTLEYFVDKFGDDIGIQTYHEISLKKALTLTNFIRKYGKDGEAKYVEYITTRKPYFSKISQKLFWSIYEILENKEHIYFAELNNEFGKQTPTSYTFYDFVDTKNKKVIEFNGDTFHANPKVFTENSHPNPFTDETALSIWNKDEYKINLIKDCGFDVLIVWEQEYLHDKVDIINKCINFLNN
jgi:very-short-patch-repair endonuclease